MEKTKLRHLLGALERDTISSISDNDVLTFISLSEDISRGIFGGYNTTNYSCNNGDCQTANNTNCNNNGCGGVIVNSGCSNVTCS